MKMRILAVLMLVLLVSASVWAANDQVSPQWWPGEGPGTRQTVTGKVAAVSAESITVATLRQGSATFAVRQETKVMVRGQRAQIGDVKVDNPVVVRFAVAQDNSRWAKAILVPKPRFVGKISNATGNTFTLTGKDNAWAVTLAPGVKIVSHGYAGSPADLQNGYGAAVEGDVQGNNITATAVHFQPPVIKGVVDKRNNTEITVKTLRGALVTVTASDATVVLVRPRIGKNLPGKLADVKPGTAVNIGGHRTGETAMNALWIDLLVADQQGNQGAQDRPAGIRGGQKH